MLTPGTTPRIYIEAAGRLAIPLAVPALRRRRRACAFARQRPGAAGPGGSGAGPAGPLHRLRVLHGGVPVRRNPGVAPQAGRRVGQCPGRHQVRFVPAAAGRRITAGLRRFVPGKGPVVGRSGETSPRRCGRSRPRQLPTATCSRGVPMSAEEANVRRLWGEPSGIIIRPCRCR